MLTGVWLQCGKFGCGVQGSGTWNNRKTRIGDPLSGWYLFALDARISPGISGLVGITFAAALPLWRTSATLVRSAPLGPVLGPSGGQGRWQARDRRLGTVRDALPRLANGHSLGSP
jgi:hypothetical protein